MEKREDIQIFELAHKLPEYGLTDTDIVTPMQVGADLYQTDVCELKDNTGDNISNQNRFFLEETGVYWIWKNICCKRNNKYKYVGQQQYRRRLKLDDIEDFDAIFKQHGMIAALPYLLEFDVRTHYDIWHHVEDLELCTEIIKDLYPEYNETVNKVLNENLMYYSAGFIMTKKDYKKYCEFFFSIISEFLKRTGINEDGDYKNIDDDKLNEYCNFDYYQKSYGGILAERLLTIYIVHNYEDPYWVEYDIKEPTLKYSPRYEELQSHESFEFNGRTFQLDTRDKDKYLVFTCAKWENDYLQEFIDHYLNLGFDKVIIADNNDDNSLESLLRVYVQENQVQIFDCRGFDSFQVQFYAKFAKMSNYKWCAYFDCDEFLEINAYSNIKDYLRKYDNTDIDVVSFNWLLFGNNGKLIKGEGTIQERFPMPCTPIMYMKENFFVKSIVRGGIPEKFNDCWFNGSHVPMTNPEIKHIIGGEYETTSHYHIHAPLRYKDGYLKHYYTKSFDEWIKKSSRGWPDGTPTLSAHNFFLLNDCQSIPYNRFELSLFGGYYDEKGVQETAEKYDVLRLFSTTNNIYALISYAVMFMSKTTDHTIIITGDVDDMTYNIIFEYGWVTGNRVVFAHTVDEVWGCYLKYNTGKNETYYMMNLM